MKPLHAILLLPLVLLCSYNSAAAPDKTAICDNGKIHFLSTTAVENIEATSNKAACAINLQTGRVSAKVDMKTFQFKWKKMQDDFNEDYIESEKYPYATLDAEIINKFDFSKDGTYNITLKGTFEIHGVKQPQEIRGILIIKNGQPLSATASFNVRIADHKIKVPTIVVVKIAEVVKVDVDFTFKN